MQAIPINRTDYCQFLTVSQKNYSLTYYAEHAKKYSHDVINRFLGNEKYTPSLLWEHVKNDILFSSNGYTIFDDTVIPPFLTAIESRELGSVASITNV